MTIPEAVSLVLQAGCYAKGGEIFVLDMGEPVKIYDMAENLIRLSGYEPHKDIKIEIMGLRPGEKLYEEVLSNTENTIETNHSKIRIAKVREYDYNDAVEGVDKLRELAYAVQIIDMVKLMKQIVPEFKSQNSDFAKLD